MMFTLRALQDAQPGSHNVQWVLMMLMMPTLRALQDGWLVAAIAVSAVLSVANGLGAEGGGGTPIALHPDNPHYLLFRGRPTVLVTSTEHYGAVLNLDFDYRPYLEELKAQGLNLTRTFSGVYCEDQQSFKIKGNPLAPRPGRLICPWARSDQPGYAGGGAKFDLSRWDEAYFARLKDFIAQAGQSGIVVELVLFCPFYKDEMWVLSPMNARNNIQGIGQVPRTEVYTLKHPELLAVHRAVTRKIVEELNALDNLYYEVCNEPYFGGVTPEWQDQIIETIVQTEVRLPKKHLIAQNIANGSKKIENPNPAVSIFNFHYATPPTAVAENYHLNKVLADDETGFKGSADATYRGEGWDFLLAGGAIYDNLDYSFTPDHEDGSAVPDAPGGGGRTLRRQLGILKQFLESFEFVKMAPDNSVLRGQLPPKCTARALVQPGHQYAVYIRGDGLKQLSLDLPSGSYSAVWTDTKSGHALAPTTFDHPAGLKELPLPEYSEDIALAIRRR